MKHLLISLLAVLAVPVAMAKLPAPDDAAKAKAAEAAAKNAWQGKVDAFQLCKSQERVAAHYRKTSAAPAAKAAPAPAKAASGAAPAAAAAPAPCADPGSFVYVPAAGAAVAAAPAASAPAKPASAAAPAKKG